MFKASIPKHGFPGLQFESPPRYWFFGIKQGFWTKILLACACLLIAAGLLLAALQAIRNQRELHMLLSQQEVMQQKIVNYSTKQKGEAVQSLQLTATQVRAYSAAIRQLNMPWQHIFSDLERFTPQDVALIHIESDAQRATIKLQAEAKTLTSLLTYATNLQQQGIFGHITYSKHETNEQDANKPVRLSFELELKQPELNVSPVRTKDASSAFVEVKP